MARRGNSDLVDLELRIVMDNADKKAIAFVDGTTEKSEKGPDHLKWFWLARQLIEITPPDRNGNTTVTMPEWLALEKGLI